MKGESKMTFIEFLQSLGRSENTIRTYLYCLERMQHHKILHNFNVDINKLSQLNVAIRTKKLYLLALKAYFNYLKYTEQIQELPKELLYPFLKSEPQPLKPLPSREQILNIIQSLKALDLQLASYIMYSTGARIHSVVSLRRKDVDLEKGIIYFHTTKRNKAYTGIIIPELKQLFEIYFEKYPKNPDDFIFIGRKGTPLTPKNLRERLRATLKNKYINPHTFRARLATDLINNDADLSEVQAILNHKNISTTARYVRFSDKEKRAIISKYHPLMRDD